jgi:hypothetical protein
MLKNASKDAMESVTEQNAGRKKSGISIKDIAASFILGAGMLISMIQLAGAQTTAADVSRDSAVGMFFLAIGLGIAYFARDIYHYFWRKLSPESYYPYVFQHRNFDSKKEAIQQLEEANAVRPIIDALKDPSPEVQKAALAALARMGERAGVEKYLKEHSNIDKTGFMDALAKFEENARTEAEAKVKAGASAAKSAMPTLQEITAPAAVAIKQEDGTTVAVSQQKEPVLVQTPEVAQPEARATVASDGSVVSVVADALHPIKSLSGLQKEAVSVTQNDYDELREANAPNLFGQSMVIVTRDMEKYLNEAYALRKTGVKATILTLTDKSEPEGERLATRIPVTVDVVTGAKKELEVYVYEIKDTGIPVLSIKTNGITDPAVLNTGFIEVLKLLSQDTGMIKVLAGYGVSKADLLMYDATTLDANPRLYEVEKIQDSTEYRAFMDTFNNVSVMINMAGSADLNAVDPALIDLIIGDKELKKNNPKLGYLLYNKQKGAPGSMEELGGLLKIYGEAERTRNVDAYTEGSFQVHEAVPLSAIVDYNRYKDMDKEDFLKPLFIGMVTGLYKFMAQKRREGRKTIQLWSFTDPDSKSLYAGDWLTVDMSTVLNKGDYNNIVEAFNLPNKANDKGAIVDRDEVSPVQIRLLAKALETMKAQDRDAFTEFKRENRHWLESYVNEKAAQDREKFMLAQWLFYTQFENEMSAINLSTKGDGGVLLKLDITDANINEAVKAIAHWQHFKPYGITVDVRTVNLSEEQKRAFADGIARLNDPEHVTLLVNGTIAGLEDVNKTVLPDLTSGQVINEKNLMESLKKKATESQAVQAILPPETREGAAWIDLDEMVPVTKEKSVKLGLIYHVPSEGAKKGDAGFMDRLYASINKQLTLTPEQLFNKGYADGMNFTGSITAMKWENKSTDYRKGFELGYHGTRLVKYFVNKTNSTPQDAVSRKRLAATLYAAWKVGISIDTVIEYMDQEKPEDLGATPSAEELKDLEKLPLPEAMRRINRSKGLSTAEIAGDANKLINAIARSGAFAGEVKKEEREAYAQAVSDLIALLATIDDWHDLTALEQIQNKLRINMQAIKATQAAA